jgi:cell division protein FtsA
MGFHASRRAKPKTRGDLIAAVDVGTAKVVCFIARLGEGGRPRIVGIGHQVSRGLRAGAIVDMDAAEAAIGTAVNAAEQMAGETVEGILVSMSGGHPTSQTVGAEVGVAGGQVSDGDLRQALRLQGYARLEPDCELIHAIPVDFAVDGARGIRDPLGMYGRTLSVDLHLVTAAVGPLRNLATCVERCHLAVDAYVAAPYAAGLATLVEDELQLGCTLIDMGCGTTGIAVFFDGKLMFVDALPVGGGHVTNDVARGLTTPVAHAERMKTLYGAALASASDERELIDVPQVGEAEPGQSNHVPKSLLTGIIQPRLEEIFELVRGRLEASGFDKVAGRRVVLTGGASQLQGVRELAQSVLDKQVRLGRPKPIAGLAESTGGPAFATAVGLIAHADRHHADMAVLARLDEPPAAGLIGRLGGWLREYL